MFTDSCRVCLQPAINSRRLEARHSRRSQVTILDMFRFCFPSTRSTLTDARYPQHICRSCLRRLTSAYNLKKMCKRTDRQILKHMHANNNPLKDTTNKSLHSKNGSLTENDFLTNIKNDSLTNTENDSLIHIKNGSLVFEAHTENNFLTDTENNSGINNKKESLRNINRSLAHNENDSLTHIKNNSLSNTENNYLPHTNNTCTTDVKDTEKIKTEDELRNVDDKSDDDVSLASLNHERQVKQQRKQSAKKKEGVRKHHVCSTCGLRTTERALWLRHLKLHPYTHYLCSYCAKGFKNEYALNVHVRRHTRDKPFACDACDRRFTQKHSLLVHIGALHRRERPFHCQLCDASFPRKEALAIHARSHTGVKAYACGVCGARFRQPANLATHALVHTGVKKFACTTCGFRTAYSSALKKHVRGHGDERAYACADCDKRFRDRCTLVRTARFTRSYCIDE